MSGQDPNGGEFGRRPYDGTGVLTYRWLAGPIAGVIVIVVLGLLAIVWQSQVSAIGALDTRVNLVQTSQATGNAELAALKAQQAGMERQLARIEEKLDNLNDRRAP